MRWKMYIIDEFYQNLVTLNLVNANILFLCYLFYFYLKIQLIIIYINQALHFSHAKLQ